MAMKIPANRWCRGLVAYAIVRREKTISGTCTDRGGTDKATEVLVDSAGIV
jgi:hypothetical protein